MLDEHRFDTRLAVREAGLAQVFGVGPQHHHLLPGQAGLQHQFVEPVHLDAAVPDGGDGIGEPRRRVVPPPAGRGLRNPCAESDPELIDAHRKSVGPGDAERAFLEDLNSHALQHRQQLAQRCRRATEVPGQKRLVAVIAGLQLQFHRIPLQGLDDADIGDRLGRRHHLLELLGQ